MGISPPDGTLCGQSARLSPNSLAERGPAKGQLCSGGLCSLNTAGLSNLCCSQTSRSISSVDRCRGSLSPLGEDSSTPLATRRLCKAAPDLSGSAACCGRPRSASRRLKGRGAEGTTTLGQISLSSAITPFLQGGAGGHKCLAHTGCSEAVTMSIPIVAADV